MTYSPATIQDQGNYTLTISPSAGSTYTNSLSIGFTVTDNLQSTGSGYYVNLPKTGAKEASLVAHHVAKVYDDGGSAGRYSDNADGTLLLSAPAGYVIRLSGTIDVADENDVLTVYNGSTTSDASLGSFNADGSVNVVSTGRQMLVRFASNAYATASGLDLTATAIEVGGALALADNADNSDLIALYENVEANITLNGRTLYKDGDWNTLCLPFDVTIAGSPLEGATVKELDTEGTYDTDKKTGYDTTSGMLYLYFKDATEIVAGKPYLVKWAATTPDNFENPVFNSVTIDNTASTTVTASNTGLNTVQFIGNYSPVTLTGGDASNYYLGTGSKLYWPSQVRTMNSFRAYFHVDLGGNANVKAFVLNLDDTTTGISLTPGPSPKGEGSEYWYDLSGRKLSGKPTQKGIYIVNGKKVVIK